MVLKCKSSYAFIYLKNETFCNLKHFGIDIFEHKKLNELIGDYIILFIKELNLNTLTVACNTHRDLQFLRIKNLESHLGAIRKLLCNIPKPMRSLNVQLPYYYRPGTKLDAVESQQVTRALCQLLAEMNNESKLESIVLHRVRLSVKSRQFLRFIFGYNNKLLIKNGKYHFAFI